MMNVTRMLQTFVVVACTAAWGGAQAIAAPVTFPNDGTAQLVNVLRRYDNGVFQTTLSGGTPLEVVDGGHSPFQWNGITTSAGTVLRFELDDITPLRRFRADYSASWRPSGGYEIAVSTTGFGALTPVVTSGVTPATTQIDTLTSAVNAKYIQYTFFGPSTGGSPNAVIFQEFQAYPDASAGLQSYNSGGSFNVLANQAPLTFTDNTPGAWQDAVPGVADGNVQTLLRGLAGAGNAQFTLDMGSVHLIESIGLGFFHAQSWENGMRIEASLDGTNFTEIFNQNTSITSMHVNSPDWGARYLRVTNYGRSGGALTEFEVFTGALPTLTATPAPNNTLDFGSDLERTELTLTNAITLQNTGELTSELQVLSYSISGPDAAMFDVPDFLPTVLTAGGLDSVQFDVSVLLGSGDDSPFSAVLTFQTNMGNVVYNLTANSFPIPEPSAMALVACGAVGMLVRRRRMQVA